MDKKDIQIDPQIYQISTIVAGDFKLQDVLDKLAQKAVEITNTDACSIRLLDDESGDLSMCSSYGLSDEYRNKGVVSKNDAVIKAAFEGKAAVLDDMRTNKIVKYKDASRKEGLVSQLTVAMEFKNKPIGVLRIYHKRLQKFDDNDVSLARLVASQCAVAIINARLFSEAIEGAKMSQQMRFAGEIQRRMIPQEPPKIKGLEIDGIYQPCFEVGGDLYDIIQLDDFSCLIVISDVIGKGIPAALMMSMFRGALRAYSHGGHSRHSLLEIIHELNRIGCSECRDGEFITLFIAIINTKDMKMKYCNCGHEPALLFRDEQVVDLDKGGLVLGVLPETEYTVDTIDLQKKDVLLFYTDGLTDSINFSGDCWGRDNMIKVANEFVNNSPENIIKNILSYRRRFVGLANQIDDTSIVVVKVKSDHNESMIPSKTKSKEMAKALKRKKKEIIKKQEKYK